MKTTDRVTPAELAQWQQLLHRANRSVSSAIHATTRERDIDGASALEHLRDAHAETGRVLCRLQAATGERIAPLDRLDLRTLAALDSPRARRLLALLDEATAEAEALDRERGNWVGDDTQVDAGETRGTDYAETMNAIRHRLQREVLGTRGRD